MFIVLVRFTGRSVEYCLSCQTSTEQYDSIDKIHFNMISLYFETSSYLFVGYLLIFDHIVDGHLLNQKYEHFSSVATFIESFDLPNGRM